MFTLVHLIWDERRGISLGVLGLGSGHVAVIVIVFPVGFYVHVCYLHNGCLKHIFRCIRFVWCHYLKGDGAQVSTSVYLHMSVIYVTNP